MGHTACSQPYRAMRSSHPVFQRYGVVLNKAGTAQAAVVIPLQTRAPRPSAAVSRATTVWLLLLGGLL